MGTSLRTESNLDVEFDNSQEQFIDRVASKYAAADDAAARDPDEGQDEEQGEQEEHEEKAEKGKHEEKGEKGKAKGRSRTDGEESTEEHPDEGTSADDTDEDPAESTKGSTEDEDAEHPEGDPPGDSDDPDDATDDEDPEPNTADDKNDENDEHEENDEDEVEISAELRAAVPVTLEDIPEGPARQLVQQKLRAMDQSYTRAMTDARAYRKDELAFRADQKFRAENPELVIVEMLQANPELFDRINERFDTLTTDGQKAEFKFLMDKKRQDTIGALESQVRESEALVDRVAHIETLGKRLATKAGLPWELAEEAIEAAILRKSLDSRDITDEEVLEIVQAKSTIYNRHVRAHRREASKKAVQTRTETRKSTPGAKPPATAASPKPAAQRRQKAIDYGNEDSRRAPMLDTARRLFPGARDE